jgi:hypothetical protein
VQNSALNRFHEYVEQTSRVDVQERRKKYAVYLSDGMFRSFDAMSRAAGGNSLDRKWLSQAMRDGQIRIGSDGILRLAAPQTSSPADYFEMAGAGLMGLGLTQLAINLEGILDGSIKIQFKYLDD